MADVEETPWSAQALECVPLVTPSVPTTHAFEGQTPSVNVANSRIARLLSLMVQSLTTSDAQMVLAPRPMRTALLRSVA